MDNVIKLTHCRTVKGILTTCSFCCQFFFSKLKKYIVSLRQKHTSITARPPVARPTGTTTAMRGAPVMAVVSVTCTRLCHMVRTCSTANSGRRLRSSPSLCSACPTLMTTRTPWAPLAHNAISSTARGRSSSSSSPSPPRLCVPYAKDEHETKN